MNRPANYRISSHKKRIGRLVQGLTAFVILWALIGGLPAHAKAPARISVLIVTGMPGGTYYHVGLGMASLWTTKLQDEGIRVSAAASEGSRENIQAIRIADADLILAEDFLCSMAYRGTGLYKGRPVPELRSVTTLWPDAVHFLIRADKKRTGNIEDLHGLVLATGLPDSGNRLTAEMLVRILKPSKRKVRLRYMTNMAGAEALRKGAVQALDLTGGPPVPLVTTILNESTPALGFLEITDAQLEALRANGGPFFFRHEIAARTYPGQEKPIHTIAQPCILAVTDTLDAEVVYALTRSLYENLDYLARVHPACRSMSLNHALDTLTVPLHPGAIRYYRERNIEIPERLIPPERAQGRKSPTGRDEAQEP